MFSVIFVVNYNYSFTVHRKKIIAPRWRSLQRSPRLLTALRGPTSKERGEEGKRRDGKRDR